MKKKKKKEISFGHKYSLLSLKVKSIKSRKEQLTGSDVKSMSEKEADGHECSFPLVAGVNYLQP